MLSQCESDRALSHDDGFEIGLHYALDSKRLRNLMQFTELEPLAAPRVPERFERAVQTDLVPETKAVGDGARDAVDANGLSLDAMLLDAKSEHRR